MHKLRPTLWRTCRVLANEQRLNLLYALFETNDQCVFELANQTNISIQQASIHLRALNSRGLIRQYRQDMRLLSATEANESVESAPLLLEALRSCYKQNLSPRLLIKQATAFTHARRIEIVQTLPADGITKDRLHDKTTISFSALTRHINKLAARGFITVKRNIYFKATPPDALSRALLKIVCDSENPPGFSSASKIAPYSA